MRRDIQTLVSQQLDRSSLHPRSVVGAIGPEHLPAQHGPTITISRQLGTNGRVIAEQLAQKLGWSFWDKDLVDAIARDADVSSKIAESFDEKTVSEIQILADTILGMTDIGRFVYPKHLARTLLAIAARGYAVILGRGSNFLLPHALNVRLVASAEYRIKQFMSASNISHDEAAQRIKETENQRAAFVRNIYGKDIEDPCAYDLTINVEEFDSESCIEVILTALQMKRHETPHQK